MDGDGEDGGMGIYGGYPQIILEMIGKPTRTIPREVELGTASFPDSNVAENSNDFCWYVANDARSIWMSCGQIYSFR